jgi:rare lipoprotein A
MSISFARAATLAALLALSAAAAAQDAGTAQSVNALPGGDARSYGYGGARQYEPGRVLDLTAPGLSRGTVASAAPTPPPAPAARPLPPGRSGDTERGMASWYGAQFAGRPTASGEVFDQANWTAAHRTLPLGSLVRVVNLDNNREILVRVTDRGPFAHGRVIDLSESAANVLGYRERGVAPVELHYMSGPSARRPGGLIAGARSAPGPAPEPAPVLAAARDDSVPAAVVVQIGAYSEIDNARRAQASAAGAGRFEIEAADTSRGRLYRVRSAFPSADAAEAACRDLADLGFHGAMILAN